MTDKSLPGDDRRFAVAYSAAGINNVGMEIRTGAWLREQQERLRRRLGRQASREYFEKIERLIATAQPGVTFEIAEQYMVTPIEPAVEPVAVHRWIPVEERLPEVNEYGNSALVLVVVVGLKFTDARRKVITLPASGQPTIAVGQYHSQDQGWAVHVAEVGLPLVSHWMPMPEPPDEAAAVCARGSA